MASQLAQVRTTNLCRQDGTLSVTAKEPYLDCSSLEGTQLDLTLWPRESAARLFLGPNQHHSRPLMRQAIELLKHERRARVYFAALTQSALGTGAGVVALMLVAYERFGSAWGISLVLARRPRAGDAARAAVRCGGGPLVAQDVQRGRRSYCVPIAFGGVALVRLVRGHRGLRVARRHRHRAVHTCGPGVPAKPRRGATRLPAATSLYGAIADLGFTAGPALAAVLLVVGRAGDDHDAQRCHVRASPRWR